MALLDAHPGAKPAYKAGRLIDRGHTSRETYPMAARYAYPGPVSITVKESTPAVSTGPKRMYQNPLPIAPVLRPQTLGVP